MLDRIGALMESLRQVSNDIAHDLRTPLAHLRYRLERARTEAKNTDDYAVTIEAAIADSDKLLAMFAALLRISQIEAGARRAGIEEVELPGLLARAGDLYKPVMDDSGHPFDVRPAMPSSVRGDPQLLLQLLANLLDNAIHHTPAGTRIGLSAEMDGGRPAIVVADNGSRNSARGPPEGVSPLLPMRAKPHDAGQRSWIVSGVGDRRSARRGNFLAGQQPGTARDRTLPAAGLNRISAGFFSTFCPQDASRLGNYNLHLSNVHRSSFPA